MPYVRKDIRKKLAEGYAPVEAGELNYALSQQVNRFLCGGSESYARYNAAIGALECLKLELYRRLIAKYEDAKLQENGDVFTSSAPR